MCHEREISSQYYDLAVGAEVVQQLLVLDLKNRSSIFYGVVGSSTTKILKYHTSCDCVCPHSDKPNLEQTVLRQHSARYVTYLVCSFLIQESSTIKCYKDWPEYLLFAA